MSDDNQFKQQHIYTFFSQKETIQFRQPIAEIQANIEKDLTENPNDIKKLLILAQIQSKYNANENESFPIYKKILQLDPKNIDARVDLIMILTSRQKYDDCQILLNECFVLEKKYWRIYYSESVYYLLQNKMTQAKFIIQNAYNMFPTEPYIIVLLAQILSEDKREEKKINNMLDFVFQTNKIDYEVALRISSVYLKTRNQDLQEKYLLLALNLNPNSQKANNNYGHFYRCYKNDISQCNYYCEKAIKLDPNYDVAYFNLMFYSLQKNDIEKSLYYLEKSYELNKNIVERLQAIVEMCHVKLRIEQKTILLLNKLQKRNPENLFAISLQLNFQEQNISPYFPIDLEQNEQILFKFINKEKQTNQQIQQYNNITQLINMYIFPDIED